MPYKKAVSTADDLVGSPKEESTLVSTVTKATMDKSEDKQQAAYAASQDMQNGGGMYNQQGPTEEVSGILDVQPEGHGFLRPKFIPSYNDICGGR